MRIFIYALQGSGASVFCYWLSQSEGYLGVIDLFARFYPPPKEVLGNKDIVLKAVVSDLELDEHIRRFQPDKKILFLRNPYQNYASLSSKKFKNLGGDIDSKFKKLDSIYENRSLFDGMIKYEDFISDKEGVVDALNEHGIPASLGNYDFRRSTEEVINFNCRHSEDLSRTFRRQWDLGNIHKDWGQIRLSLKSTVIDELIKKKVDNLCPKFAAFYSNKP